MKSGGLTWLGQLEIGGKIYVAFYLIQTMECFPEYMGINEPNEGPAKEI